MDKSTLSNYGWVVIVTLVLAVMLALATPFGSYVGKGASNVIKTFVNTSNDAIDEDNIDTQSDNWDAYLVDNDLNHALGIHEGGSYITSDGETTEVTTGNSFADFPTKAPQVGDTYVYGDYEYKYGYELRTKNAWNTEPTESLNGWGVRRLNLTQETYGDILQTINGKPIVSLSNLFNTASKIVTFPDGFNVPDTVVNMTRMFYGCTSLTTLPETFKVPSTVRYMEDMFQGCKVLTHIPQFKIPHGVTSIKGLFHACYELTLPVINIPSTVTNCEGAFKYTTINYDIVIPETVTNIGQTFTDVKQTGGKIIINSQNLTKYDAVFGNLNLSDGIRYRISGTSPYLQEIANQRADIAIV